MDAARYVRISAGGGEYALDLAQAAEILPLAELHRPAGAPPFLAGFLNLDGAALPVLALAALIDPASEPQAPGVYAHLVRLKASPGSGVLLLVDRVVQADAEADAVEPLDADQSLNGVLSARLRIGETFAPLLEPERLLMQAERVRLEMLRQAAEERLAAWGDAGERE